MSTRAGTASAALLLALVGSPFGCAATSISPFATVGIEHDSNVFMRPSGEPPFLAGGVTGLGDTMQDYEAGVDAELDWGSDRLTLSGTGTRDDYNRFSFLDHTEYRFGGNLDWRLGPIVDGTASYRQDRYMAPFSETFSTELLLDTERTASTTVRVRVSPMWRVDLTPELHQLDSPLPGFPDFTLHETTGTAELDYLGLGRLTAGLQYEYDQGRYADIVGATRYDQRDANLTASYKVSGLSTFSASAGYAVRDTEPNPADNVPSPAGSGIVFGGYTGTIGRTSSGTGSLGYTRQLTGKTSATISFFRRVDSYAAGANPEIATGGSVGADWRADPKFIVHASYSLTHDQVQGGLVIVGLNNRTDRTQAARIDVRYSALSWLTIRPYLDWNKAVSTFTLGNYSQTIVGIDVTGRLNW
jgi:hypothetical protein